MESAKTVQHQVKEKYGRAARAVAGSVQACCDPGLRCCDPITANLYSADESGTIPEKAVRASLGCGNPTALIDLRPGETVLDLGSGGGLDVLLSAKRVGPTGRAYGLNMTDEMLALARENQKQAGAVNVEFLKGEIENIPLPDHYKVLFLCTGNSARSIMAEAILNHKGKGRFTAYSAGSHPAGKPRPEALQQIESARLPTAGLRSKSWDEFSAPGAPNLDFVFTVCDNAAKEQCPYWPGQPMTAHWGVPDPAAVKGTPEEIVRAFRDAFTVLDRRIGLFLSLPLASLEEMAIKREIDQIGRL